MSTQDSGHCSGTQTYPPPPRRCACGDIKGVHALIDGERRACSRSGCGCQVYREGDGP